MFILKICSQTFKDIFSINQYSIMNTFLKRALGYKLNFGQKPSVQTLLSNKDKINQALDYHGCICIQNVDFSAKQMMDWTNGFFGRTLKFPAFLLLNNMDPVYPDVTRIGNVLNDGTLKDSQKQSAYWHQDGDYMGEDKKQIYSTLHSKQQPTTGGETVFMDLIEGAAHIKKNHPQLYKRIQGLYGALDLQDIDDFKKYGAKNTLNVQTVTKHQLIRPFGKNGHEVLYLSGKKLMDKKTLQQPKDLTVFDLRQLLEKQIGVYEHKWQKGDFLVYDNVQVIHKAIGRFTGRRLLYRTYGEPIL